MSSGRTTGLLVRVVPAGAFPVRAIAAGLSLGAVVVSASVADMGQLLLRGQTAEGLGCGCGVAAVSSEGFWGCLPARPATTATAVTTHLRSEWFPRIHRLHRWRGVG